LTTMRRYDRHKLAPKLDTGTIGMHRITAFAQFIFRHKGWAVLVVFSAVLFGAEWYFLSQPSPEPAIRVYRHFLAQVGDRTYLIHREYRKMEDGVYDAINLHASMPDLEPWTFEDEKNRKPGSPRQIDFGITDRSTEVADDPDLGYIEWTLDRYIRINERDKARFQDEGPLLDFPKAWKTFIAKNEHRENILIDASHLLNWTFGSPDQSSDSTYIMFRAKRLVLRMDCHKPVEGKSPQCDLSFHEPGVPYSIHAQFNAIHLQDTQSILEKIQIKLAAFNRKATPYLPLNSPLEITNELR